MRWTNLFITGSRGSGKSTVLFRSLVLRGTDYGGFAVKKRYVHGRRASLVMVDLAGKSRSDLVVFPENGGSRQPQIHPGVFARVAIPAIRRAVSSHNVVVMDELGRIELDVPDFMDLVLATLSSPVPVVGVLKAESNLFLDGIRARADTRLVNLDPANRQAAFREFSWLLGELLGCNGPRPSWTRSAR